MRLCLALIPALLAASPLAAQNFDQAVRQNIGTGLELCLNQLPNGPALVNSLIMAGFGNPLKDDLGDGETMHRFYAPAESAEIWVKDSSSGNATCFISSEHLNASEAIALVGEVLDFRYAGQFTPGEADGSSTVSVENPRPGRFCTGFHGAGRNAALTIHFAADTIDPLCRDDGTVAIHIEP